MKLRRTIHPETKVIDAKRGLVEYIASDESIDSYREIIRAKGWRFDRFAKNAPFVDSHDYNSLDKLMGKVVDFKVAGGRLVETVQWAIDVPENKLAQLGWKMTEAGYLKAVSVGFIPEQVLSKWNLSTPENFAAWQAQLLELGLDEKNAPRAIYTQQQQIELSSCIIGANANALAKSYCPAYKAGLLTDADLEMISSEIDKRSTTHPANGPTAAERVRQWERWEILEALR